MAGRGIGGLPGVGGGREVASRPYARRLARRLDPQQIPRHVGVIVDGNRRWARSIGEHSATGHRAGADKIHELLGWCEELDVEVVTLWLLSTENLSRPEAELASLVAIIEDAVTELAAAGRWRVHPMGALDLLPDRTARLLKEVDEQTSDIA